MEGRVCSGWGLPGEKVGLPDTGTQVAAFEDSLGKVGGASRSPPFLDAWNPPGERGSKDN